ncbi:MAG: archaeosortase/exosortase family protein [Bacteroidales bacterium]|nr:archaeosortase/exosortase family protein [Bacteroidales bacterium]
MKFIEEIKTYYQNTIKIEQNRFLFRDVVLLFIATIVFHILYWATNMGDWIFGPFTKEVYDFFTYLAYKGSEFLCKTFLTQPFDSHDSSFFFYFLDNFNEKVYFSVLCIVPDCSGVKQLLQWLLVMLLCRGKFYKRMLYWFCGSIIIICVNIIRIFVLAYIITHNANLFDVVHDWVARPLIYIIIFVMWWAWLKLFLKRKNIKQ